MDLPPFTPGQIIGLAAVLAGPMIAMVAIAAASWTKVRRAEAKAHIAEMEAVLKQQMIERGMPADEIERVLEAGVSNAGRRKPVAEEEMA